MDVILGEIFNYINGLGALVASVLYFRKAFNCKSPHWRRYKYMLATSMFVIFTIYLMFILKMNVHPLAVRFNTTLFVGLMICNAILGGSKYGKRY